MVIAAGNVGMKDPQQISNLRKFVDNYDWSGLEFPVPIKNIRVFEMNNRISVNVLVVEGKDIYICWKGIDVHEREINLMLVSDGDKWHYTAIKSLSRLLSSSNSKHMHKQYFCTNCIQGFTQELRRNQHRAYCKNNESVKVDAY